jgi:hypothetical protein
LSFTGLENRRAKQVLCGGVGFNGREEDAGREYRRVNIVQIPWTHVCKWNMIPVETIPGMEGGGVKENGRGVNLSMIYLIHCKNFYKHNNVSSQSTTIK